MVKLLDYYFMGLHCVRIQTADSLSVSRQPDSQTARQLGTDVTQGHRADPVGADAGYH